MTEPTIKILKLRDIQIDCGTQTRAKINEQVVAEYSEDMLNGDQFEPMDVCFDGVRYILSDGFHRFFAAETAGIRDFPCRVLNGTVLDAIRHACGANRRNGLRRSTEDKKNCVKTALANFAELSDRRIADMCGVSHAMVSEHRKKTTGNSASSNETRIGADGKERKLPKKQPTAEICESAKAPTPKPAPEPEPEPLDKNEQFLTEWGSILGQLDNLHWKYPEFTEQLKEKLNQFIADDL